jgi:hypothetical protein
MRKQLWGASLWGRLSTCLSQHLNNPQRAQPTHPRRRRGDSGFALLLVFLMAAVGAILLYKEIPRVAFETQRQKEQLLIERGQQYKRAIQLFMRANNNQRWPASMDELESFNRKRFLRHRYKDPMTGKDEWRLVHIQNGVLTDSVNNKPPAPGDQKDTKGQQAQAGGVGDYGQAIGNYAAGQAGGGAANAIQRRRTSDTGLPAGMPGAGGSTTAPGAAGAPQIPGQTQAGAPIPGQPGLPQGIPGLPGQAVPPGSNGFGQPNQIPGQVVPPPAGQTNAANPAAASQQSSGYGGVGDYSAIPTPTAGPQPGGVPGQPPPGMPGQPGLGGSPFGGRGGLQGMGGAGLAGQPGQPGAPSSAATNLINNLLTSPRPGGLGGIPGQNTVIGGGIAGIASTEDGDSIMIYNNRTNYAEWEFIFDPAKQHYPPPNPVGGSIGTAASQMGTIGGNTPGTPAGQLGNMPGMQGNGVGGPGMQGMPGQPGAPGMQGTPPGSPFGQMGTDPDMRAGHP